MLDVYTVKITLVLSVLVVSISDIAQWALAQGLAHGVSGFSGNALEWLFTENAALPLKSWLLTKFEGHICSLHLSSLCSLSPGFFHVP